MPQHKTPRPPMTAHATCAPHAATTRSLATTPLALLMLPRPCPAACAQVVLLIFVSGKIVLTGAKDKQVTCRIDTSQGHAALAGMRGMRGAPAMGVIT